MSPAPILLVDDDDASRRILSGYLTRDGFRVVETCTASVSDIRASNPLTPVILVFNAATPPEDVVAAVRSCCPKAGREPDLFSAPLDRHEPEPMLGNSQRIREIRAYVAKVTQTDSSVLITGETGTGKELVARSIHRGSSRSRGPFVSINCAAIPDGLLESELFGHEAGAFTGAQSMKEGHLQAAHGGTVFFDEIGDMGSQAQAKILRVIEGKPLYRVGGRRSIPLDFRVVAATNQDLDKAMAEGRFRMDLYYRINVARIHLPPLRERTEDIPVLVVHEIDRLNQQFGRRVRGMTDRAMQLMMQYDWPGNVRELRNVLEAAFINLSPGPVDDIDLPDDIQHRLHGRESAVPDDREHLLSVLESTKWNKSKAAQRLHWSRMTLYRKLAKYQLLTSADSQAPVTASSSRQSEEKRLTYSTGEPQARQPEDSVQTG